MNIQAKGDATSRKTEVFEGDIHKLKTKVEELAASPSGSGGPMEDNDKMLDPWADYLNKKKSGEEHNGGNGSAKEDGRALSEEDQRTLIVGGWLPDTRRAKIEEEAKTILEHDTIQPLIDAEKLVVFGPRRSFGMLRFQPRGDESPVDLKKRMWEVVSKIRGGKFALPSTQGEHGHGGKTAWASFLKTPEARRRSALCSLIRRVTMQLAGIGGDFKNDSAMSPESYGVDWGTGTIWNGELKLGSATHRKDNNRGDDFFQLPQGWVDLRAVTTHTGVERAEAMAAFQREL